MKMSILGHVILGSAILNGVILGGAALQRYDPGICSTGALAPEVAP